MIILGIDPSLTGTGLARIDTDDRLYADTVTITSKGSKGAGLPERHRRLASLAHRDIADCALGIHYADGRTADLVVIEAPSLGQARQGGTLDRHGLWWLLIDRLYTLRIAVATVTPAARAKYATGKGNAGKDTVLLEVARRFPHVDVQNNNEADALILAAMGARWAGTPIDEMPKTHTDALAKVEWPARLAVA